MGCCDDIEKLLSDYIDGELDPESKADMDAHMSDCPPCLRYLESFRSVVHATREIRCEEIPPELADRLRRFLAERVSKP